MTHPGRHEIEILDQHVVLHPDKVMFWTEQRMMILSDLHLGKSEHFRKNGIPLPISVSQSDIARLEHLIERLNPVQVLIVGDLFHSTYNPAWEDVIRFFRNYPDDFWYLVPGNHDILEHQEYIRAGIHVTTPQYHVEPFLFTHDRIEGLEGPHMISGHIHPGVRMRGKGMQSVTLPCFLVGEQCTLLPAFGGFTGLYRVTPESSDRVFAIVENEVIALDSSLV